MFKPYRRFHVSLFGKTCIISTNVKITEKKVYQNMARSSEAKMIKTILLQLKTMHYPLVIP